MDLGPLVEPRLRRAYQENNREISLQPEAFRLEIQVNTSRFPDILTIEVFAINSRLPHVGTIHLHQSDARGALSFMTICSPERWLKSGEKPVKVVYISIK